MHPFELPNGILLDEAAPHRSACVRCSTCDGFPCLVNGKADAQTICVEPALQQPNVALLTDAYVSLLATGPSGRFVERVVVQRNGQREEYRADVVVEEKVLAGRPLVVNVTGAFVQPGTARAHPLEYAARVAHEDVRVVDVLLLFLEDRRSGPDRGREAIAVGNHPVRARKCFVSFTLEGRARVDQGEIDVEEDCGDLSTGVMATGDHAGPAYGPATAIAARLASSMRRPASTTSSRSTACSSAGSRTS